MELGQNECRLLEWHQNEWNDTGMNGITSEWMEWHRNEWIDDEYNDKSIWNDEMTGGIGKFTN